jgi:hypothetical protein
LVGKIEHFAVIFEETVLINIRCPIATSAAARSHNNLLVVPTHLQDSFHSRDGQGSVIINAIADVIV